MSLTTKNVLLEKLYNIILNSETKDFEREILIKQKNRLEKNENERIVIECIKDDLRPYAIGMNLSKEVNILFNELCRLTPGNKNVSSLFENFPFKRK